MSNDLSAWQAWDRLIHGRDPNPLGVLRAASQFQRYFEAMKGGAVKAAREEQPSMVLARLTRDFALVAWIVSSPRQRVGDTYTA